jgi:hypothetical protein
MFRVEDPEFDNTSWITPVVPVCTLPKLRLPRLAAIVLGVAPVPIRSTVIGCVVSVLTDNVPACVPVVLGVNFTVNVALCPGASMAGKEIPVTL